ncbi:isoprenyl transferase [Candidatus Methylacidithermus pantelleriae]|uniref:Isoprenyl transferase n=1 Tax=Candidatus Methylacidithermus pantelleriae TaxID=2744239 RepID=A0A8J2BH81_9BACT|nr:isoprenyl transferase [Candidatus Methylacidithermus pantelleriae]CAF0689328.1 Isoprenyl transferase [Candidatus Methylacidithermus pantelleriae]
MSSCNGFEVPRHVAIIMDGNGRWAKARRLPRSEGHRRGFEAARRVVEAASELGIGYLTLYAFSVENWARPSWEVRALMEMLEEFLRSHRSELVEKNIRLEAIGRLTDLPPAVRRELEETREATSKSTGLTVVLALSYGGRVEIVEAARSLAVEIEAGMLRAEEIDETLFRQKLYTAGYPDPDLLIRTSGEKRISNFLLWQIAYTELYVSPTLWPDFGPEEFLAALQDYAQRQRRFGRVLQNG